MSESRESVVVDHETSERGGVSPLALGRKPVRDSRESRSNRISAVMKSEQTRDAKTSPPTSRRWNDD